MDNALSPRVAEYLRPYGFDAVHVRDLGLAEAADDLVLARAAQEQRVLISRDSDFAALLSHANLLWPSFVHLRTPKLNRPHDQVEVLRRVLVSAHDELSRGAIVTVRGEHVRVRMLPIR